MTSDEIVNTIVESNNNNQNKIFDIKAVAGSGKTTTATKIIESMGLKKGLYLVFNKANQMEMKQKLKDIPLVDVRTIMSYTLKFNGYNLKHGSNLKHYDYQYFKNKLKAKINNLEEEELQELAAELYKIYMVINQSGDDIGKVVDSREEVDDKFKSIFKDILDKHYEQIMSGQIQYDIQTLSKLYLSNNNKTQPEYDYAIVDECVTGDTLVELEDGVRSIKNVFDEFKLNKELKIKSYNHLTNTIEYKHITKAVYTGLNQIYRVITDKNNYLDCTDNNKLYVNNEYKYVRDIKIGDKWLGINGIEQIIEIKKLGIEHTYDLTVADNHNFFVVTDTNQLLVHNCQDLTLADYRVFEQIDAKNKNNNW